MTNFDSLHLVTIMARNRLKRIYKIQITHKNPTRQKKLVLLYIPLNGD